MQNIRKKILLFTDTICDANGVSRFIQDMLKEAKQENIEFYVVSSTSKSYCDKLENAKILKPIFRMKMPFYKDLDLVIPPYFKMKKLIKQINPDIIHISTPGPVGICGLILAKKFRLPILGTYHTDFPMYIYKNTKSNLLKKLTQMFLKFFYKDFDKIITRSKEYIGVIKKDIDFKDENICFLQPGTNTQTFSKKYKNKTIWDKLNISSESFKMLYVGRATKEKNLDLLFEIWKEFYNRSVKRQSHLIIVGNGDLLKYKDELKKYNILFLGHKQKEELSALYASSSIFVFPSTTDTLGQVVLESLASGTPAIVTSIGGPQSIINSSEKKVGIVLDMEKSNAWVDKLIEIENENISLDEMGKNAYEFAQKFSIKNTFISFYNIHCNIDT